MDYKEVIAALRSAPIRSKRELFDTAADMIEAAMDKPVVSHGDWVRAMSDEELADWHESCPCIDEECTMKGCVKCISEWLKQPARRMHDGKTDV